MIHLGILQMDMSIKAPFVVFLTICINCISGLVVPAPKNVKVDIWDGEAIAYWSHPQNFTSDFHYNVETANYSHLGEWLKVNQCTGTTHTYCDLTSFIQDYSLGYKVKVQLVVGKTASAWTKKKFVPNSSKLRPTTFTLRPTSSSLTVLVHQKPILFKLFPFGFTYTIYLEQRGEDNKNITAYLGGESQSATTFWSLRRGPEYCVSVRVASLTSPSVSSVSPKQCVSLPEQELYAITTASLSILAVLALASVTAAILQCHLRRPEKTPAALKLAVSGWLPLSVGEGTMEVVTDKGWFLSSYRPGGRSPVAFPDTGVIPKGGKGEERRPSMDSGVSMEPGSAGISPANSPGRQDDSGFGSLSGSESSTSSQTEYSLRAQDNKAGAGTDGRPGLDCQLRSSPANLGEQDGAFPKAAIAVGSYRSQSPSAAAEVFETMHRNPVLAEVVSGYRAAPQACLCSGAGQCTWCHKQGLNAKTLLRQSSSSSRQDALNSITFLGYPQKMHEDAGSTLIHLGGPFPTLATLAPQDMNMNFSLSLCDVQMAAD